MGREHNPAPGKWYENLEDEDLFKVILVDEDAELIEIQYEDGDVEVAVGDRLHAMVVSTAGRIQLSRKGVRESFATGYGSCSFDEPLDDLKMLGLV